MNLRFFVPSWISVKILRFLGWMTDYDLLLCDMSRRLKEKINLTPKKEESFGNPQSSNNFLESPEGGEKWVSYLTWPIPELSESQLQDYFILTCGHLYKAFSWMLIDVRESSLLWAVPYLGSCVRKPAMQARKSKPVSGLFACSLPLLLLTFLPWLPSMVNCGQDV